MAHDRGEADLRSWAKARAPSLLARAEAEAVDLLRDALVHAALGSSAAHRPASDPTRDTPQAEPPTDDGELVWAYCVLLATHRPAADLIGIGAAAVRAVRSGGLIALVSSVPQAEFGAEPLRANLNDIEWLERVARSHESVLDATLQASTIVPLRLCTLYESDAGVRAMLEREHGSLADALERLDGRWEWAVKLLVDEDRLLAAARTRSADADVLDRQADEHGEGGAYMLRRRLERRTRDEANSMATEVAQGVHARLQDWALDAVTRPPQNRDLSRHRGEMLLNAAYLVDRARGDELRRIVEELEESHRELGVRIELTGPWPPYNFVADGAASLA